MHAWSLAALPLAIGLASFSGSAGAVNFNIGDVQGQLDSQISIGMSVSTADADKRFIHNATSVDGKPQGGKAVARTSDDGRLNYEKGDIFSKIFRGVHDLELRYGDSGTTQIEENKPLNQEPKLESIHETEKILSRIKH
eukprot:TRINITY_DN11392_c0_g1_i7.p1 TRINITY_DN11392_c0_g1~~TRINITY_DN11392_c0_g1_i7.p1  ORF type:complete len:139 (+),score=15.11 TRINITY_DN11392_c0_g1_i7:51-467(+)